MLHMFLYYCHTVYVFETVKGGGKLWVRGARKTGSDEVVTER